MRGARISSCGAVSRAFARRSRQIFEWALLSSFEASSDDLGVDENGKLRRATRVRVDDELGRLIR